MSDITLFSAKLKHTFLSAGMAASLSFSAVASDGPPGTDIIIGDLEKLNMGIYVAKNFSKVTTRKGYDNQPYFLPDGSGLLYTAILPMKNGQYQSDSFEYNFASGKHSNLTNTDISEYSPILMDGGRHFSSVVVEKDGKQKLWAYPYQGRSKAHRLLDLEPVGYHAWGKNGALAMFVLGEPHTLQYRKSGDSKIVTVAENIGRSIRYVAERDSFSFTQLHTDGKWWLSEVDVSTGKVSKLVPMPKDTGYYTWVDDKTAVTALKGSLYLWRYNTKSKQTSKNWFEWVDVSSHCKTQISRLAVNHDQTRLAFVCDE